jgi:uncharacterized Tic20 family protein
MPNEQLVAYVHDQLGKGVSRDEIIRTLIATGWLSQDINTAFESSAISIPNAPEGTSAKLADVAQMPQINLVPLMTRVAKAVLLLVSVLVFCFAFYLTILLAPLIIFVGMGSAEGAHQLLSSLSIVAFLLLVSFLTVFQMIKIVRGKESYSLPVQVALWISIILFLFALPLFLP